MTGSDGLIADSEFTRLLGAGRGIDDARALRERLMLAERELGLAMRQCAQSEEGSRRLQTEVEDLESTVHELSRRLVVEAELRAWTDYRSDIVRYALVRSGRMDLLVLVAEEEEHQGAWTPGRPYLSKHHVFHPQTGACFAAVQGGVPAGLRPGRSRRWEPCGPGDGCPEPPIISPGAHPVSSGYALRQEQYWWDKFGRQWALADLSREHLLGVIDWLHAHLLELWDSASEPPEVKVPCPRNAYETAEAWLTDTPLMRGLRQEKRRRRIRRSAVKAKTRADEPRR